MKVALYPGTFNPIHIGHVTAINYAIENFNLDIIYIIPNKAPVHKKRRYIIDPNLRLKIIQLTIQDMSYRSKIKISDFEIKSQFDSYTYITVEHFRTIHALDELFIMIGLDSLLFYRWNNFDLIFKNIDKFIMINNLQIKDELIVFMKNKLLSLANEEKEHNDDLLNMIIYSFEGLEEKFSLLNIPLISISSSLIWERLIENKSIDYWVNEKVKHILYKLPLTGS